MRNHLWCPNDPRGQGIDDDDDDDDDEDDDHPTKFGCRKISSSADVVGTVIFDQMSPHCDPELEDRNPIFLHS